MKYLTNLFQKKNHVKNILSGDCIEIGGKKFVKIRLRLIDSMDYKQADFVHNLETENAYLQEQIEELYKANNKQLEENKLLQIVNTNQHQLIKTLEKRSESYSREISTLNKKIIKTQKEKKEANNRTTYYINQYAAQSRKVTNLINKLKKTNKKNEKNIDDVTLLTKLQNQKDLLIKTKKNLMECIQILNTQTEHANTNNEYTLSE